MALLARRPDSLSSIRSSLLSDNPSAVVESFPTDTTPANLEAAFAAIASHPSFASLKLRLAIYNVKHSSKSAFLDATHAAFVDSLAVYAGGAFAFAQLAIRRFLADHPDEHELNKGALVFTGTLGALRCSAGYAAYGAGRAAVRQLAQSLAREFSEKGVHVVHTIANGPIEDEDAEEGEAQREGRKMSAESVGRAYLWAEGQTPDLWVHEMDMRPAREKF